MTRESGTLAEKSTVLGVDISYQDIHLKIGLVRNFYLHIPVSTNQLFTVPFQSYVDAKMGITSQTALEVFSTSTTSTNAP